MLRRAYWDKSYSHISSLTFETQIYCLVGGSHFYAVLAHCKKRNVFRPDRAGAKSLAVLPTPYGRRNLRIHTSQLSAGGSNHGKCARDQARGGIINTASVCISAFITRGTRRSHEMMRTPCWSFTLQME